jgi:hypothetical protein
MLKMRILAIAVLVFGLSACESMDSATQTFKSINKVLSPLTVLKKGSS